ncbi:hypothetical protein MHYP_G00204550 [Metynnis hypsauchen]
MFIPGTPEVRARSCPVSWSLGPGVPCILNGSNLALHVQRHAPPTGVQSEDREPAAPRPPARLPHCHDDAHAGLPCQCQQHAALELRLRELAGERGQGNPSSTWKIKVQEASSLPYLAKGDTDQPRKVHTVEEEV